MFRSISRTCVDHCRCGMDILAVIYNCWWFGLLAILSAEMVPGIYFFVRICCGWREYTASLLIRTDESLYAANEYIDRQ
jgi:hypothetical protein